MDITGVDDRPVSELEIVGEVILGENREGGTIINEEELVERNWATSWEDMLQLQQSMHRQRLDYNDDDDNSNGYFDIIVTAYRTWMARLLFPHEYLVGDDLRNCLTDEEIDELALFQGSSVEAYMEMLENSSSDLIISIISNTKKSQITAFLQDDNFIEWERRCQKLMPPLSLHSNPIMLLDSHREKLRAYLGSWSSSKEHCSQNIFLLDDQVTAHRIPVMNQTDAVRGKFGVSKGVHAWDLTISGPLGTHCTIGIALKDAPLVASTGYLSLIGNDEYSWGWDLMWGNISHGGKVLGEFPSSHFYEYTLGDTIRLILDCDNSKLSFAVNYMGFGTAFEDLPTGATFYPTVGLVYGNLEVSLLYLGAPPPSALDIEAYCDENNNCDTISGDK